MFRNDFTGVPSWPYFSGDNTTAGGVRVTLENVIQYQSRTGGWVCPQCFNYEGGCKCSKGIFIAFVGGCTLGCWGFEEKCPTCGQRKGV